MINNIDTADAQARRLEEAYAQLDAMLQQPGVMQRLRSPAGENEWSTMQILGHTVEMIPYWLNHCQILIASTTPSPPFGRSLDAPERIEGVERGAAGNPDSLMRSLKSEIQTAAATIRAMSPAERSKTGIHIRRGEMTVAEAIETLIVAHAEEHVAQVRTTLQR